ncbi:MAG: LysE family translocator [Mangrovicoccus sp.]|nr:LysE family translocator [Mangrovicoccus sp.]
MTLAVLLSVMAAHLAAAISPGPAFVMALRISARSGAPAGAAAAFGLGLGAAIWAMAAMLGLAALFRIAPDLLLALRLVGAGLLLMIAVALWRGADSPLELKNSGAGPQQSLWSSFRLGLITQLANPKPAVFFGAVFIGLLPADMGLGWAFLVAGLIWAVETGWFILVALVFSQPWPRSVYMRAKARIDRAMGGALALFSAKIALG